jgi:hypothetical protein
MNDIDKTINLYRNMSLEEAVSHRIHSRIFEVLGYLAMVDKSKIQSEDLSYISRAEDLCKVLISELHEIIDQHKIKD